MQSAYLLLSLIEHYYGLGSELIKETINKVSYLKIKQLLLFLTSFSLSRQFITIKKERKKIDMMDIYWIIQHH